MPEVSESKYLVMAGWKHVPHLDEKTTRELLNSTPLHLQEARSKGIPIAGSGLIFASQVPEESIKVAPFPIPEHWPRLAGIDFGWDHPTAVIWGAWDRDNDVVYLTDAYKASRTTIPVHASAIRGRGAWIPVAWPHDGLQVRDGMQGEQLAAQYRKEGVNMLPIHAQYTKQADKDKPASVVSVEAGVQEMLSRMQTGRLKVFSHLEDWLEEFRIYRRENGLIVKLADDAISASRYLIMMLRFAALMPEDERSDGGRSGRRKYNWKAGV